MDIYRNYSTLDVLYDKPCHIQGCGKIYPIKVRDFIDFQKIYNSYFIYTKQHLDSFIPDEVQTGTLRKTMAINMARKCQPDTFGRVLSEQDAIMECVKELEEAFSIVTRKEMKYSNGTFSNRHKETTLDEIVKIDDSNFDYVSKVIVQSNLINQLKYYKDPAYTMVMEKARKAHNKNPISFEEMICYIKTLNKISYEEVMTQNVLQLNCDFQALAQAENYRTMMNFRLVSSDKSLLNAKLTCPFIDKLYDNSDNHLLTTLGALGV